MKRGKQVSRANRSTSYNRSKMPAALTHESTERLENKKYLSTYSKIHQIASAADQLIAAFYAEEITLAK